MRKVRRGWALGEVAKTVGFGVFGGGEVIISRAFQLGNYLMCFFWFLGIALRGIADFLAWG